MGPGNGLEAFSPFMMRAIELARRGQGAVEPNPMVGCLVVQGQSVVGEGWHQRFGGPHAEIEALRAAGSSAKGATLVVTLEPCCHHGKTPPCSEAIVAAGVQRVIVAETDPFPRVAGGGLESLRRAGVQVDVGLERLAAARLTAPFRKLVGRQVPWLIAKWAMTLDGKMASRSGDSKWISSERSRAVAHQLRGRVDAVLVGHRTCDLDDPLLTARPAGPRVATRIVLDSRGTLGSALQLVRTASEVPVLIVTAQPPAAEDLHRLVDAGCEVITLAADSRAQQLEALLQELGRRQMTNVLVEGGGAVLGAAFDAAAVDEVHVFIAPKLLGGQQAAVPLAGQGLARLGHARRVETLQCEQLDGDIYLHGRLESPAGENRGQPG